MKKFILAAVASAAFSANAMDVGFNGFEAIHKPTKQHGGSVTISENVSGLDVSGGFGRVEGVNGYDRWTANLGKELVKLGPLGLNGRVGLAYIDNKVGKDGSALTAGLGATVPLTKKFSITASFDHQFGSNTVANSKGNVVTAGFKVGF